MANNTKKSKATEQQSYKKINTEPIVMEDKTAEILKQIEENKRKEEEKKVEMKDNYPRYQNVDITKGLTKNQVEERIKQGYTNVNDDSKGKSIFEIIISNVFTAFNILYFIIAIILIFIDIKNNDGFSNLFFLILVVTNTLIGIFLNENGVPYTAENLFFFFKFPSLPLNPLLFDKCLATSKSPILILKSDVKNILDGFIFLCVIFLS